MPRVAVPAGIFVACLAYGLIRLPQIDARTASAPHLTVGLVQTNIGADAKAADPEEFVTRHREMSRALIAAHPNVDLIVWPESAYNRLLPRGEPMFAAEVTRGIERPLLFGALTYDYRDGERRNLQQPAARVGARQGRDHLRQDRAARLRRNVSAVGDAARARQDLRHELVSRAAHRCNDCSSTGIRSYR